ncbi:MAG TPA: FHA domain-containing protein [Gemmatimonadales bacterium]
MLSLELGGKRYPVTAGEIMIGSDEGAVVSLAGEGVAPRHAVVQGWPDGSAAVRPIGDAEVRVNGVRLGTDPIPLLHGDKLHVGDHELLVVDQKRAGSTQVFTAIELPSGGGVTGAPTRAMTAGRIVSLTDGREYQVAERPTVFGRDASSDIVVPGNDVSRRHAEIHPRADGYVLIDTSVNGTFVRGERVSGDFRLGRGDVIRIGTEEFRFYADVAPEGAAPDPAEPRPTPPPGAEQRLNDTFFGVAAAVAAPEVAAPAQATPLASVLVRNGERKGDRHLVRVPIANIGRADYNDIVIADPSVSTMHAKLQRRGGIWMLSDLGSTNGTFVDGELATGEVPLGPGATIRLGEVALLFEPLDDGMVESASGQTQVMHPPVAPTPYPVRPMEPMSASAEPARKPAPPRPRKASPPPEPERSRAPLYVLLVLLAVAVALAAYLMLQP